MVTQKGDLIRMLATEEELRTFLDRHIAKYGRKNVRFVMTWWRGTDNYLLEVHAIHRERVNRNPSEGEVFYVGKSCGDDGGAFVKGLEKTMRKTGRDIFKRLRREYPMVNNTFIM